MSEPRAFLVGTQSWRDEQHRRRRGQLRPYLIAAFIVAGFAAFQMLGGR